MVDDEKHEPLSKRDRKDYMRHYMRERRKRTQLQPAPLLTDLHGPVAPKNLPRTESVKALLQAHYAHVLNLWAETGKELAHVTETDEIVNTLESLMLENRHLKVENDNLREALKTCPGKPQETETQEPPKTQAPQETLQPSKPPEPGFVDPDRRPSSADEPEPEW